MLWISRHCAINSQARLLRFRAIAGESPAHFVYDALEWCCTLPTRVPYISWLAQSVVSGTSHPIPKKDIFCNRGSAHPCCAESSNTRRILVRSLQQIATALVTYSIRCVRRPTPYGTNSMWRGNVRAFVCTLRCDERHGNLHRS